MLPLLVSIGSAEKSGKAKAKNQPQYLFRIATYFFAAWTRPPIERRIGQHAATPHSLTREEVFVVLEGAASVRIAGNETHAAAGDAIVVPAGPEFELANAGAGPLRLLCCLPVGGQARLPDGSTFTPPWAE